MALSCERSCKLYLYLLYPSGLTSSQVFNALTETETTVDEADKENPQIVKDIATLTRFCIGTAPTKPTAGLYHRIAFIVRVSA